MTTEIPSGYSVANPAIAAGFQEHRDCTVRAFVNLTGAAYAAVHAVFAAHGRKNRRGFRLQTHAHDIARDLGVQLKLVRRSGSVEKLIRLHPTGKILVRTRGHAFAVVDGVIHDSFVVSGRRHVQQAWLVSAAR